MDPDPQQTLKRFQAKWAPVFRSTPDRRFTPLSWRNYPFTNDSVCSLVALIFLIEAAIGFEVAEPGDARVEGQHHLADGTVALL